MSLLQKPKVIIIHDHPDLSNIIRRKLASSAHCLMAPDLETALTLFEENPDILLGVVDGVMPKVKGGSVNVDHTLEFLMCLRDKPKFKDVILVAYSGTHNKLLVEAGCNFECQLDSLPRTVMPILEAFTKYKNEQGPLQ